MKSEGVGLVVGYLYFSQAQDLDLSPDSLEWNWSCGNFPTICNDFVSDTMVVLGLWEFFPPLCLTQSHYKWW